MAHSPQPMTFENILENLRNKVYHPVYFLQGEEPYYIDVIADFITSHILDENEKEFNQSVLYGRETNVPSILECAKRFPMASNYQVVMVKEAQQIKEKDLEEKLIKYIENPLKSTILVLCYKYKYLDGRKAFSKAISKKGILFDSDKIYENKIPDWIASYLSKKNYRIAVKATMLLTEYLGNDLGKIVNELDKLILNVKTGNEINTSHIEQYIGISKDFNVFELQNALGAKNFLKANQIINYFSKNTKVHPLTVTLFNLYSYFSRILIYHYLQDKSNKNAAAILKVHPFFLKDYQVAAKNYSARKTEQAISILREYDRKSKGVNNVSTDEGELLKEMVYKLLH